MNVCFGVLITACLLAGEVLALQSIPVRAYLVPNHGSLRLTMPESWSVESRAMADPATLFLHIVPPKGKAFDLQITAVWLNSANLERTTPESIKANTERTGNGVLLQAVEKTLTLQELHGSQTVGTYYTFADRKPGPGEFKYLTQGSFLTGEMLSAFTLLSDNPNSSECRQLLKMMSDAAYVKASS